MGVTGEVITGLCRSIPGHPPGSAPPAVRGQPPGIPRPHPSPGRSQVCRQSSAPCLFYNQHQQQLLWKRSAATWSAEHHEHSLLCAGRPSLGVVTSGAAETQHFYYLFFQSISTFFFQEPSQPHSPEGGESSLEEKCSSLLEGFPV